MAIYANFITGGVNNHTTTSEEANSFATDFVTSGVVGTTTNTSGVAPMTGGLAVNAQGSPNMTVAVTAGQAYVTAVPSGQGSQRVRVYMSANENVTIAANSSGSTRYDWVYMRVDAAKAAAPNLAGDDVASLVTSRSTSATSDDGTPPTYGIAIAVVTVANGATSITNGNIRDVRSQALITATSTNDTGWTTTRNAAALPTPNTVAYNGNRSYTLTFNSTDLTGYIAPGMRVRTTRTVSAPTQCTSLNGSTQYFNRASASLTGMTFTDDFTVSAWVKVSSYASGVIVGRYNGTSGWYLIMTSSGVLQIVGHNNAASNFRLGQTFQSVPLNKWVHITAFLDMSGYSYTTDSGATGSYIMIDGVVVPGSMSQGGTNPASLLQAGDLQIGAVNGATTFFPGKIAQAAIFNARITPTTIRGYISQGLSGTETNLISAYSFNGVITDLNTTNANNLTAQGSAVATNDDSPFTTNSFGTETGTLDYGLVQRVVTTSVTVQVPEGCTIPTSGGVSAMSYSTQQAPYGFTIDKNRWEILCLVKTQLNTGSVASSATITNIPTVYIVVPVGIGDIDYNFWGQATHAGTTNLQMTAGLSTTNNSFTDLDLTTKSAAVSVSVTEIDALFNKLKRISLSSQTIYYLNVQSNANNTTLYSNGVAGTTILRFTPAGV